MLRPQLAAVPKAIRRQCPDHLGQAEHAIWKHILSDYRLTTETAIDVLTTCLEAHMRARECREAIARDGMTVVGRDNQQKPHPLLSTERDARAAWLAGIKQLGLEL